jgi:uncharacterized protein (DUF1684 family)
MISLQSLWKSGWVIPVLTFLFLSAGAQSQENAIKEIEAFRKKEEAEMKDKTASPLLPRDRKKFKRLNFYPIDLKYRVLAKFVRTENPIFFKMKTTSPVVKDYSKYGEVHFMIDSQQFILEVYQSPDLMKVKGYEDYLFIPFTDATNGEETYEVGRYIEFRIPKSEDVIIDFNQCYNPYCAYGSGRYSCPIPPAANSLPIAIPAGEKKFKLSH